MGTPDFHMYLNQLRDALAYRSPDFGELLSYRERNHAFNHQLFSNISPNHMNQVVTQKIGHPWDELVSSHLRCCYYVQTEKYVDASKEQQNSLQVITKILQGVKEDIWPLGPLLVTARDARLLAIAADRELEITGTQEKPNEHLEKIADLLMGVFRVCATDTRTSPEKSKRMAMMGIINQLFKIYFKINKLHLCKPLIRALDNAQIADRFPKGQQVTYKYFLGVKCLFDSDFRQAEDLLTYAFNNCHPRSFKNKRLILIFLIPVKMLMGKFPKERALTKYNLVEFAPLIKAVKKGDLKGLDAALAESANFFWTYGIYLILEKLRIICYRNIFKKVSIIAETHLIPISWFKIALDHAQSDPIDIEEVHCILANLIFEDKIKGYISLQHQKLVVSKQNPFPPLASVCS